MIILKLNNLSALLFNIKSGDLADCLVYEFEGHRLEDFRSSPYYNVKNIAIIFHTIITSISEFMVEYIKKNINLILHNRIKENIIVIKKDFIFIFCKVKENLEINFIVVGI